MLDFDSDTARLLDDIYSGSDFARRRTANFNALAPSPGDRVLDIGCGPGHMTLELSRAVGETGLAIGIDPSAGMRETAAARCAGRANVRISEGNASALPLEDEDIDKAVAIQVFEYLDDIPGALREAHRVLKPGGRLVVGDIHFDSLVWHSDDMDRMERMVAAWDRHLVERRVPGLLPDLMWRHGFVVDPVAPCTFCDTELRPDGLANMMILLMSRYAARKGLLDAGEAEAWAAEQRARAAEGRFFFSLTHFVVTARKA